MKHLLPFTLLPLALALPALAPAPAWADSTTTVTCPAPTVVGAAATVCTIKITVPNVTPTPTPSPTPTPTPTPTPVAGSVPFTALHTYFMSPAGKDSNPGTAALPWASPNHPVQCGDVVIADTKNFSPQETWGAVSNCPSTSGGIDGKGGVYFAVLLCGGASVGACTVTGTASGMNTAGMNVNASNWAVEGFDNSQDYKIGQSGYGFAARTNSSGVKHHIAFLNDIAHKNAMGFGVNSEGFNGGGVDYFAVVGSIAQDSAGRCDGYFDAAIDLIGTANFDTLPGTHFMLAGNFSYNHQQPAGCGTTYNFASDGEAMMLDTLDAQGTKGQVVVRDNILSGSTRMGLHVFYQGNTSVALPINIYNNTLYNNNSGSASVMGNTCGWAQTGLSFQSTQNPLPYVMAVYSNISQELVATCQDTHNYPVYAMGLGTYNSTTITVGGAGKENVLKAMATKCQGTTCAPSATPLAAVTFDSPNNLGTNLYIDPAFKNGADFIANRYGAPNCAGFASTTACMAKIIDDMTPTASQAVGKGYRAPGPCKTTDPDFPVWLKGITFLHWDGANLTEQDGLVNKLCGT